MNNLGFSIGGTHTSVCLADGDGQILNKAQFATDAALGSDPTIGRLHKIAEEWGGTFGSIGIAVGAPVDPRNKIVLQGAPLASWTGIDLGQEFQCRAHGEVLVENDANAAALAELYFGAAKGKRNFIFLTFGTGMGAGIFLGGRLLYGEDFCAGEVAHILCKPEKDWAWNMDGPPTFENICAGLGIAGAARYWFEHSSQGTILPNNATAKQVFEYAALEDDLAQRIVRTVGEAFGQGVAALTTIHNPALIVAGGIYLRQQHVLAPYVEAALSGLAKVNPTAAKRVRVVPSGCGEDNSYLQALAILKNAEGR